MKNITVRGFSTLVKTLRKHITEGTYANFWGEIHKHNRPIVNYTFTLAGEKYKFVYMDELVDKMVELMPDITDREIYDVINVVLRISFLYEDRYWFMVSINEAVAYPATIEADKATDVLFTEDNGLQQATDVLNEIMVDVDQEIINSVTFRAEELMKLSIKELRDILKTRDVRFAPASKEAKLIELILGSE